MLPFLMGVCGGGEADLISSITQRKGALFRQSSRAVERQAETALIIVSFWGCPDVTD